MDSTSVSLVGTLPGIPAASASATSVSPVAPSSASATSSSASSVSSGGSTALFVAEIPLEVTEAEFRSTFSGEPGYISARLRRDRNENTVGFVEFSDHKSAAEAREQFNNFKFSHNDDHGITIHFAHEHTRNKHREREDGRQYGGQHYDQASSSRKGYNSTGYRHDGYGSMRAADVNSRVGLTSGLPLVPMGVSPMMPATSLDMSGMQFYSTVAPNAQFASYVQPQGYSPQLSPDAAPTLYVEGLPLDATEREVAHIFRQMPGYLGIRIKPKESKQHPSRVFNLCWVEFETKYNAAVALHHLKGYKMDKNDTKGLTISYAKTTRKERRGPSVHGLNGMPLDKSL